MFLALSVFLKIVAQLFITSPRLRTSAPLRLCATASLRLRASAPLRLRGFTIETFFQLSTSKYDLTGTAHHREMQFAWNYKNEYIYRAK
jgi:hypothetical protein